MVRDAIEEYTSRELVVVIRSEFAELHTEIDLIVVMNKIKRIYFGSCKMSPSKHEYLNLLAHATSFYNNRGWNTHKWFSYEHVFVFISPDLSPSPVDEESLLSDLVEGKVDLRPLGAPEGYEVKEGEVKEAEVKKTPPDSTPDLSKPHGVVVADITTDTTTASTPQQIDTDEEGDMTDISPNPTSPPLAQKRGTWRINFMDSDRIVEAVNERLEGGQSDRLKSICDRQLSNKNMGGRAPFKWNFELTAEYRALAEQRRAVQPAEDQTKPLPTSPMDVTSETTTVTAAGNPAKSARNSGKQKVPGNVSAKSESKKVEDSVSATLGSKERFKVVKSLALDIGDIIAGKLFADLPPKQYQKTENTSLLTLNM